MTPTICSTRSLDMNLDPGLIAHAIEFPLEMWPSACTTVIHKILDAELVEGREEYGFYWGPVAKSSMFHGTPMSRHGWIQLPDERVYDPTRWVFEDVDPYIYVAHNTSDYDPGMRKVRASRGDEASALEFLDAYSNGVTEFEFGDIVKLGNTFPEHMPGVAAEVYEALAALGHQAVVPIDFWKEVMDG